MTIVFRITCGERPPERLKRLLESVRAVSPIGAQVTMEVIPATCGAVVRDGAAPCQRELGHEGAHLSLKAGVAQ